MKTRIIPISTMCYLLSFFLFININTLYSQEFTMNQTLSDGAQRNTIAFDGLAFLTGDFCACSFIPPGKVADYFGFQYLRDNDITQMGHTTDFNTVIANNLLYVLDSSQKASIVSLAKAQVSIINQYAYDRFPLIKSFIKMRDEPGNMNLDKQAVLSHSAALYKLDGRISMQRAQLYGSLIKSFTAAQKHYLDSVKVLGMKNMPVLLDQIDKRPLNNNEFVGTMSIAGDIFAWYAGSVDADVYFCPERQGDYFGGFYIKDAPAMGNHGYSIDTSLTQNGGIEFLNILTPSQRTLITGLVDTQRTDLYTLVDRRRDVSNLLRGYLTSNTIDTSTVLSLSETYGQLDGEISYYYATHFSKVGWTLNTEQKDSLKKLRNLDNYPCVGAYLYSDSIGVPNVDITDFFFSTVPVKLINFSATALQKSVQINWTTANEADISYFTVERSNDGKTWESILSNNATNTNNINEYIKTDESPLMGNNYYRLKSIYRDGSITLSAIQQVNFNINLGENIIISQNPISDFSTINFNLTEIGFVKIVIYNSLGEMIKVLKNQGMDKGNHSVKLIASDVKNPGLYFCHLQTSKGTKVKSFVVLK